jgi:FAD/FMN-containing dehydrogenase
MSVASLNGRSGGFRLKNHLLLRQGQLEVCVAIHSADTDRLTSAIRDHLGKSTLRVSPPGSDDYAGATRIWNGAVTHEPLLIAQCCNANDARAALHASQACGAEISVRGGGHDWTGRSLRHAGLVIDLSNMRQVAVDAKRKEAVVGGGATTLEVCDAALACNLAAVASYTGATVGMGGLLLGGGYGPITPRFGLSCDSLLSAEVVLADGRIVTASESENPDLFWALRGCGGNFGVVTSMRIRLYDLPTLVAGSIVFPWSESSTLAENP